MNPEQLERWRRPLQSICSRIARRYVQIRLTSEIGVEPGEQVGGTIAGTELSQRITKRPDVAVIVLADHLLSASPPSFSLLAEHERWTMATAGHALHEVVHILDPALHCNRPMTPPSALSSPAADETAAAIEQVFATPPDIATQLAHHGPVFIRIALHVGHRYRRITKWPAFCGHAFDRRIVDTSGWYGLSDISAYAGALAGEPERLERWRWSEILSEPTPPAFCQLWRADLERIAAAHADETARLLNLLLHESPGSR